MTARNRLLALAILICIALNGAGVALAYQPVQPPRKTGNKPVSGILLTASKYHDAKTVHGKGGGSSGNAALYKVVELTGCDNAQICSVKFGPCAAYPHNKRNDWVPYQVWTSTDHGKHWRLTQPGQCLNRVVVKGRTKTLDPKQLTAVARKLLPKAAWHHFPAASPGLVRKPEIFTVVSRRSITFPEFQLLGHDVTVKATIKNYHWDFGDRGTLDTTQSGRDYDETIGSCTPADCGAYVNHPYQNPATYHVLLTVDWTAEFRADGGPWQDIPGNLQTTSPAQDIPITTARSVLVQWPQH